MFFFFSLLHLILQDRAWDMVQTRLKPTFPWAQQLLCVTTLKHAHYPLCNGSILSIVNGAGRRGETSMLFFWTSFLEKKRGHKWSAKSKQIVSPFNVHCRIIGSVTWARSLYFAWNSIQSLNNTKYMIMLHV